jgi:hypothetical protein
MRSQRSHGPQHASVALASAVKAEGLTERDEALWL